MAEYGKLFARIWSDRDFTALTARAQQVYAMLCSHSSRNMAGVLPVTLKRWANSTNDATVNNVTEALQELAANKFVVIDWDTEELLIRTFIRNDEVYRQPNLMKAARKFARQTESAALRWVLHDELSRLPDHKGADDTAQIAKELVDGLQRTPPKPFTEPFREPIPKGWGVGGYVSGVRDSPNTGTLKPAPEDDTAHRAETPGAEIVVEPAYIETVNKPTKRQPSSAAKTVVRQELSNAGYPRATMDRLAVQVDKLAHDKHPDRLIRESLREWDQRPNCDKPEFLPTILGDLVKRSRAGPGAVSAGEAKVLGWADLGNPTSSQRKALGQ